MKTFKQHITELFDRPVKGTHEYDHSNGRAYKFFFNVEDREYRVMIFGAAFDGRVNSKGLWEYTIEFSYMGDGSTKAQYGQAFGSTGFNKDQIKVLSAVIQKTWYYFTQKNKLNSGDQIYFVSDDAGRDALYTKFATWIAANLDMELRKSPAYKKDSMKYTLIKR